MSERYNGWTNFETWRVRLEVLDGMIAEDFGFNSRAVAMTNLADALASYVDELVFTDIPDGLAKDLAASFIDRVNFSEIADHMIEDLPEEDDLDEDDPQETLDDEEA